MADAKLEIEVLASTQQAVGELQKLNKNVSSVKGGMEKFTGVAMKRMGATGVAAGAMGGAIVAGAMMGIQALKGLVTWAGRTAKALGKTAVVGAIDFQFAMAKARTMFRGTEQDFRKMTEAAEAQAVAWGVPAVQQAIAVYDIFSGVTKNVVGAQAFLLASNELAAAGFADFASANKTLMTAMNALQLPMERAREIASKLWATTDVGVIRLDELNATTGKLAGSMALVPFEEIMGVIGIRTKKLGTAEEATTGLKSIFDVLTKTEGVVVETAKKHGIVLGPLSVRQQGLIGIMEKLVALGERDINALRGIVRETRAWNAVQALLGGGLEIGKQNVDAIRGAVENYSSAIDINLATTRTQLDRTSEAWKKAWRDIGDNALDPMKESLQNLITPHLQDFSDWAVEHGPQIAGIFNDIATGVLIASEATGVLADNIKKVGKAIAWTFEKTPLGFAFWVARKAGGAALGELWEAGEEARLRLGAQEAAKTGDASAALGALGGGSSVVINTGANYIQTTDPCERVAAGGSFNEQVSER